MRFKGFQRKEKLVLRTGGGWGRNDSGTSVKIHAVGWDNRKHLFSHHGFQLSLFPKTPGISFQFYDRKHRIHFFVKICFPSNFNVYSVLQKISGLNLK